MYQLATLSGSGATSVANNLLGMFVTVGAAIVACVLIYSIIKSAIDFSKGQGSGSVWSILGKVLFLILCVGLIYLAKDYTSIGEKAKNLGNSGLDKVDQTFTEIVK